MMRERMRRSGLWALLLTVMLVASACAGAQQGETQTGGGGGNGDGGGNEIQTIEDLTEDHVVGVQDGTTGKDYAEQELGDQGVKITSFPEGPDAYQALDACQVDAVINDEPTAVAEVQTKPNLELIQRIDTGEKYGIAVDPSNKPLLDAVNATLASIIEDGTYSQIYSKYKDLPPGGDISQDADTAAAGGTPSDIQTNESGTLTVGSDIPYPPFEFRKGGKLAGLDIDLVNEIGKRLELNVRIIDTDFTTIFTQLAAGRYDVVVAASTITPAREKKVNFSDPYYNSQQSLTVNPSC